MSVSPAVISHLRMFTRAARQNNVRILSCAAIPKYHIVCYRYCIELLQYVVADTYVSASSDRPIQHHTEEQHGNASSLRCNTEK